MRRLPGFTVALFAMFGFLQASEKPNLLFIYLDDFGWRDTSYMGSDFYETPNIDALAREGMIFNQAYSSAANCAPARAGLMSGQYSPRHEIYNVGTGPRGKAAHRRLNHIPGVDSLDPGIKTWANCLEEAGYLTASMGKWHVSNDPTDFGFAINVAGTHSGSPPKGYYPPHPNVPGLPEIGEDEYLTDTLSSCAVDFVSTNADKPWVLYLTHFAVHTPLDARKDLVGKYESKTPGTLHDDIAMATMIEAVDEGIGEIIAALDKSGTREQTIIVFFSDNGGYGPATDMAPLKGYKGTYYEGGIRVPLFFTWPGVVEPNSVSEEPVIGVDLFPTFCEMLGAELPAEQKLDGVSLVPHLKGAELEERSLFWHFPAYLQSYGKKHVTEQRDPLFRSRPCSIVRAGDWKLHQYFEKGEYELYNLREDPGEMNELSLKNPDKFRELKKTLLDWQNGIMAPIPSEKNPDFNEEKERAAILKAFNP